MITENKRRKYASDLTDSQWEIIAPLFPCTGIRASGRSENWLTLCYISQKTDVNGAIFRTIFTTYNVSNFYYTAIKSELWKKLCAALVEKVRVDVGRTATPSYGIIISRVLKPHAQ